jgi:hypothetical protein
MWFPMQPPSAAAAGFSLTRVGKLALPAAIVAALFYDGLYLYILFNHTEYKNDFGRMYYSALAFREGQDMYGLTPAIPIWDENHERSLELWNLGPPHLHLLFLPFTWLPLNPALLAWEIFSAVCLVLSVRIIAVEIRPPLTPLSWGLVWLWLFASAAMKSYLSSAHITFVLMLVVTWMWRLARRGQWSAAGAWLGVALSVKPFLLILVPHLVLRRRWRALLVLASSTAACYGLGWAVFGMSNHVSWYRRLQGADSWAWVMLNASLEGFLSRSFSANPVFANLLEVPSETVHRVGLLVSSALALLTVLCASLEDSPGGVDRAFALLLAAALFCCPLGWIYYLAMGVGPVLAVVASYPVQASPPAAGAASLPWGRILLLGGIGGMMWPIPWYGLGQPSPVATLTAGSAYFWALLAIWLGLLLENGSPFRFRSAWRADRLAPQAG